MSAFEELRRQFGKIKPEQKRIRGNSIVSYSRVSDFRQAEDGDSIDTQTATMQKYARENGFSIVKSYEILGESARKGQIRPSINELMEYVKDPKNNISNIIIFHSSRLTRDGVFGSKLVDELIKLGIGIIDCDEPIDIFNFNGRLRQIFKFYEAERDNNTRKTFFNTNLLKKLRTGQTMGKPPMGYTRHWIGTNKDRVQKIVINEQGKILKKVFQMKLDENLTNVEVAKRARDLGLEISLSRIGAILSNPYYCGTIKDIRLIEENGIIKGNHPSIVSIEDFLIINGARNKNLCNKKKTDIKELPLRRHLICSDCEERLTGEFKSHKNQAYYRCTTNGCKSNTNTKILHPLYIDLLNRFTLNKRYGKVYEDNLTRMFEELNKENKTNRKFINSKIKELELEKIGATRIMVREYHLKDEFEALIKQIDSEIDGLKIQLSFIRNDIKSIPISIKNAIELANNIPLIWENGTLENRIMLQNTLFPKGVFYDKKSNSLKPVEVNKIIDFIPLINDSDENSNNPILPNIPPLGNGIEIENRTFGSNTNNSSTSTNEGDTDENNDKNLSENNTSTSLVAQPISTSNLYSDIMGGITLINNYAYWDKVYNK